MQPNAPNSQYDFILRDPQTPKKRFSLPLPKLPRPLGIIAVGVLGIFALLIIVALVLGGRGGSFDPIVRVIGRAEELKRVSTLAQAASTDADVRSLAATVSASASSDQQQLTAYLTTKNAKVSSQQQSAYEDKTIDSQLNATAQNNKLGEFYLNYLRTQIVAYQAALQTARSSADAAAKPLIDQGYGSSQIILKAPGL